MPTIHVVVAGCYSDFHIVGMFSTEKLAQEYIDKENAFSKAEREARNAATLAKDPDAFIYTPDGDDDMRIHEYELDELKTAQTFQTWRVRIKISDGSFRAAAEPQTVFGIKFHTETDYFRGSDSVLTFICVESSVSAEHAIKVAVEKRQEWLRMPIDIHETFYGKEIREFSQV